MTSEKSGDQGKTFAELFEESLKKAPPVRLEEGQEVEGKLLQIGQEWSFLDIGAKGEALIATRELMGEDDQLEAQVGDLVTGRVLRRGREGIVVSRVLSGGSQGRRALEDAYELGLPVEGVVQSVIKGGLDVEVAGQRAFCPASQAALHYVEDLNEFTGQKLTFRITEYRDGGRSVVLSRKALLAEERAEQAEQTRKHLEVGAILRGTVSSIRDFGAFVDVGGVEGLLHVSEISHSRVENVSEVLTQGQVVEVVVIRMEGDRLSLSMKSLAGDPWDEAATRFPPGSRHKGVVTRLQPFGAFVELAPGLDGLLHVSTLDDPRITDARRVFEEGQEVEVEVVSLDPDRQRVGLAPVDRSRSAPVTLAPGVTMTRTVDRVETYGVFLRLPGPPVGGRSPRGLLPREEIRNARDDLRRSFPIGSEVRVLMLEPDEKGRLRLSQRAVDEASERAQSTDYLDSNKPTSGFGTFADLLQRHPKDEG